MKTQGRPKSTNVVGGGDPKKRKLGNENIGQDKGKLSTFLDKMQPGSSTPKRSKRKPTKNINKGGKSTLTT